MKAEFVTCYEVIQETIWLRNLITSFSLIENTSRPITIYCDNTATVIFSQNNKNSTHTKHFDVKYQFMKENIREHITYIKHIFTNKMLANPLIKGLAIEIYHDHVTNMGLANSDLYKFSYY